MTAMAVCVSVVSGGCAFKGLNSLPLPGAVGRDSEAHMYQVEIANVATLEPNSPVMVNDVIVGSVRAMSVVGWHANVDISVRPDTVVPANAVATIGQTSLLGSMHLALNPPLGQPPSGSLAPGTTIGLNKASTYPSTERTLSTLSTVVNAGGLGQLGDIVHNFNLAVSGRAPQLRDLLNRLNNFVGTLDAQRGDIVDTINEFDRVATTLAGQNDVIARALRDVPPALKVLVEQRPRLVEALEKLGNFTTVATRLLNDTKNDLTTNLRNLGPALCALADVGPDIDTALAYAPVFPLGQNVIDRAVHGDYLNLFATFDLTNNRIKRGLAAGTPLFQADAPLVPAPGDPGYDAFYTDNPLGVGVSPTPPWLASLPEDSPPLHLHGVAPLDQPPPILTLPVPSTPSGC
jgi:virulence factor Mce-like protein